MSIRPTDLQIIVQRAQEVERLQQTQQQQEKVQQQQFAQELQKQDQIKDRQVANTKKSDEVEIRSREKSAGQNFEKESKKNKESKEHAPSKVKLEASDSEHVIDIKI